MLVASVALAEPMGTVAGPTASAVTTAGGVASASNLAPPPGISHPVEDSYYPDVGDPGVDVLTTDLQLRWARSTRTLSGTALLRVRATADASSLQLDLAPTMSVTRVDVVDAASRTKLAATFAHPGKNLRVELPVVEDGTYDLTIGYHGRPGPIHGPSSRPDIAKLGWETMRDGQAWSMQEPFGAYSWFPSNDQPSDKVVYSVRLDVPRPWVGVSNGRLVSRRAVGSRQVTEFANSAPMAPYLLTVAIGPYRRHTDTGPHGLPLTYWVPVAKPGYLQALRATPATLTWLESKLGPYPFDRAGVVVVPGSGSAMETQTMVTLGAQNYRWGLKQVQEVVAHELVHSWYGDSVTPTDWRDVWMSEGMAMYLEARYTVSRGWVKWGYWQRQFEQDDGYYRRAYGPPGDFRPGQFGQTNVYYCAARMWDHLRRMIGEEKFDQLVRDWPQSHPQSNQTRESLVAWVDQQTGRDLDAWFHTWLTSPTPPSA